MSNTINSKCAYKVLFSLNDDSSLDDFWSFMIFKLHVQKSEPVYDRFARLYNLLSTYIDSELPENKVDIQLEESSQKYHLSIRTQNYKLLEFMVKKFDELHFSYRYTKASLSYEIDKKSAPDTYNMLSKKKTAKTHKYNFISNDDLEEMQDILEKLNIKNYAQVYEVFDITELNDYRTTFSYYSSYLRYYRELSNVNNIIAELSVILSLYTQDCLAQGNDFRMLLSSFLHSVIDWQDKLFIKGNEKIDFMDKSLKADLAQIKMLLNLYDTSLEEDSVEESIDAIFDF